jgi:predicted DNA-binding transcriptional regulator YafY
MSIGENIKRLRKLSGLEQTELAERLHVSNKTISSWEIDRTEPSLEMLVKLSDVFGCSMSFLIHGEEDQMDAQQEITIKLSKDEFRYLEAFMNLMVVEERIQEEGNQENKEQLLQLKEKISQSYYESKAKLSRKISDEEGQERYKVLEQGIAEKRKVKILYYSFDQKEIERVIQPSELFWSKESWYCVAFCELRQDTRVFELNRIRKYELLDDEF